jgi:hypothetical protein
MKWCDADEKAGVTQQCACFLNDVVQGSQVVAAAVIACTGV